MFDLITGTATHIPRRPSLPILVSTGAQLLVLGLVVALPIFGVALFNDVTFLLALATA